jgi:CRP-like cAMP-binding protein
MYCTAVYTYHIIYTSRFIAEAGSIIGETSLLSEGSVRVASLITDEPVDLLVIDRPVFDRYLKELVIQSYSEKGDFLASMPVMSTSPPALKTSMIMLFEKKVFSYNEMIIKQGQSVSAVFFVIQ